MSESLALPYLCPGLTIEKLSAAQRAFVEKIEYGHEAARARQRGKLLGALHRARGFVDLRAFGRGRPVVTASAEAGDADAVEQFVAANCDRDLFVGVASRASRNGRGLADCAELHALFVDLDFKTTPEAASRAALAAFALPPSAIIASGGGLHLYWILSTPQDLAKGDAPRAKKILRALATALGGDLAAAEPARILRMPGTFNFKYDPPRRVVLEKLESNRVYTIDEIVDALPPAESSASASAHAGASAVGEGERNSTLFREGARLRRLGLDEAEISAALAAINSNRCRPPLDAREVEAIAASAARYEVAEDSFPLTESGDAEFFVEMFADRVRYDHRQNRWLLFENHIWAHQSNGEIGRLALEAMRARQRAAVGNPVRMRWAIGGEARKRQWNMLALAQNVLPTADAGEDWDRDPWLLGTPNGIVDLRSSFLRPGRTEDRITMRVRPTFNPEATCPLWDRTIADIFGGDADLIAYFDRLVGYSLTGDCREEIIPFCWGNGANGKSTILNTLAWVLGDYADDIPFSALELHERTGIPNDIAKIVGKRFVTSSETGETKRLNEARVKALTGRDPITARFLHREFFSFIPAAKFWLATNAKPIVRDTSVGFWRRIHSIPFSKSFATNPDMGLKDRLRDEASGILARAVRGCLQWQRDALSPPAIVRVATNAYRGESAPLARFLDARCVIRANAVASFGQLFEAYLRWCGDTREATRLGRHDFGAALRERFPADPGNRRTVTFMGVGLGDLFTAEEL